MGRDPRRPESHGGAWKTESWKYIGQQRHVQLPHSEYLVPSADPGQRDRLPQPVRKRGAHGDRWGGNCGDDDQHSDGDYIL